MPCLRMGSATSAIASYVCSVFLWVHLPTLILPPCRATTTTGAPDPFCSTWGLGSVGHLLSFLPFLPFLPCLDTGTFSSGFRHHRYTTTLPATTRRYGLVPSCLPSILCISWDSVSASFVTVTAPLPPPITRMHRCHRFWDSAGGMPACRTLPPACLPTVTCRYGVLPRLYRRY